MKTMKGELKRIFNKTLNRQKCIYTFCTNQSSNICRKLRRVQKLFKKCLQIKKNRVLLQWYYFLVYDGVNFIAK